MNDREPPRSLGAALRARRQELGWSQETLAARVAAHGDATFRQSDVSRLERGKVALPHRERLSHIATVLGLSLGELLARSGWADADLVFTSTDATMLVEDYPPAALVTEHPPAAPAAVVPRLPEHALVMLPQRREITRLREVLVQAKATGERTRQILAECEAMRPSMNNPCA